MKLAATQTFKTVSYLLAHPNTSQVEISRKVGASRDLVNYVVRDLQTLGIVRQQSRGHLELRDPLRLLDALSIQRPLSRLVIEEIRTEQSEISRAEKMVKSAARGDYALTCFSALSKYIEYYITYPTVHVYSGSPDELQKALIRGRGDVVVQVLRPDSELIFKNARKLRDLKVVEPIQAVIDLFCLGGPGRDGAVKLYQSLTEQIGRKEIEKKGSSVRKSLVQRAA